MKKLGQAHNSNTVSLPIGGVNANASPHPQTNQLWNIEFNLRRWRVAHLEECVQIRKSAGMDLHKLGWAFDYAVIWSTKSITARQWLSRLFRRLFTATRRVPITP